MPSQNPIDATVYDLILADIANPAVGVDLNLPVPANARIQLDFIAFRLVTDANAADRYMVMDGHDPTYSMYMSASPTPQTASLTWNWFFVAGLNAQVDLSAENIMLVPMSPHMIMEPGEYITSQIQNIQVGDQLSFCRFRYKQWIIA